MEYRGKKICAIEVYDESERNKVIARICDNSLETTNGYKIRIVPHVQEVDSK